MVLLLSTNLLHCLNTKCHVVKATENESKDSNKTVIKECKTCTQDNTEDQCESQTENQLVGQMVGQTGSQTVDKTVSESDSSSEQNTAENNDDNVFMWELLNTHYLTLGETDAHICVLSKIPS